MRTQDEILKRIKSTESMFGFNREVLVPMLAFENAKEFLTVDSETEKKWKTLTEAEQRDEMKTYMEFAWGKVSDHRGLSAGRSVEKMCAWTWLLGTDEQSAEIDRMADVNYPQYGAPVLKRVCEIFGLPMPDDESILRMTRGEPCTPDCEMGCGT
jgi:hypothetical protein